MVHNGAIKEWCNGAMMQVCKWCNGANIATVQLTSKIDWGIDLKEEAICYGRINLQTTNRQLTDNC